MIPKEFFQHIHRLEVVTRHLVSDLFVGEYESVFKGRGIEFSEVREYQVGDDIRTIDWNVTARTNRVHTKRFIEERELTLMFLVDVSGSSSFGSLDKTKREFAAEISALIAYSAFLKQDRIGMLLFSDRIEKFLPPRKGRTHLLKILRDFLYFSPKGKGTDLTLALNTLNRIIPRRCIVFIVSDFFMTSDFWKSLRITQKRHDLICLVIGDHRETRLPRVGWVEFEDAETGEIAVMDTREETFVKNFERRAAERHQELFGKFHALGIDAISVTAGDPYIQPLMKFFVARKRRR